MNKQMIVIFTTMSKYNIVYIFGAGASASALYKLNLETYIGFPLANDFYRKIEEYHSNIFGIVNFEKDANPALLCQELDNIAKILRKKTGSFKTIDEGMKFQYINNIHFGKKEEFNELKKILNIVFNYIEFLFLMEDNRYKQLLITLMDNSRSIPENVNFLSWNYDNQLNIAYGKILSNPNERIPTNKLYHLNGSSSFLNGCYHDICHNWINASQPRIDNDYILKFWKEVHDEYIDTSQYIKFAWENGNDIDLTKIRYDETKRNILVYIGYSHPYVNHPIDLKIIQHYNPLKIYIQDPAFDNEYANSLNERFNIECPIKTINNCDRFYIPNEMYEL